MASESVGSRRWSPMAVTGARVSMTRTLVRHTPSLSGQGYDSTVPHWGVTDRTNPMGQDRWNGAPVGREPASVPDSMKSRPTCRSAGSVAMNGSAQYRAARVGDGFCVSWGRFS